jgi:hypothetical protein
MTTAKAQTKEPKKKTVGTVMAEKLRAEANGISDSEREVLLKEGLRMIYGGRRQRAQQVSIRSVNWRKQSKRASALSMQDR